MGRDALTSDPEIGAPARAETTVASSGLRRPLDPQTYALTRFAFLRFLGLIDTIAFLVAENQLIPLVGSRGLEPAAPFLEEVRRLLGSSGAWLRLPTLFWWGASDAALRAACHIGLALSLLLLAGYANVPCLLALWVIDLSIVQVGQVFWGYGWESLLLETGFLAVFLVPLLDPRPWASRTPAPKPVMWLLRWVLFRLMFGAGLIKLRGDPCWRDLTCMMTHYETQPLPNPLSWYLHQLPRWVHQAGVLFNHYAELVAPWFLFGPRKWRLVGAASIIAFQLMLIASGNLSWLNWLTITLAIAACDDAALERLLPSALRARWERLRSDSPDREPPRARRVAVLLLCAVVGVLSIQPVINLLSPGQRMNSSFDPLYLVNTYGAFGSINRQRFEIILEGTEDDDPEAARWTAYEFRCKPGDVTRRPCVVAPYHLRIDWQMWFAAMSTYREQPWILHLADKLLRGDPGARSLLGADPFEGRLPKFVRAELYRYEFTRLGESGRDWWRRTREDSYFPPLSRDDADLAAFLRAHRWVR
jgi:hypothetical protein